jgi:hypothetical protein
MFNVSAFDYDKDSGDIIGFFGAGADSKEQSFKFASPVKGTDLASTLVQLNAAINAKVKADVHAQLSQKDWSVDVKPVGVAEAITVADEVFYCRMVEEAIPKGGLYDVLDSMSEMLKKLIDHVKVEKNQAEKSIHDARINIAVVWKRTIAKLIRSHCMNIN